MNGSVLKFATWEGVRHVLTALGAGLVTYGAVTADEFSAFMGGLDEIAGGILVVIGQVGNFVNKQRVEKKIDAAAEVAATTGSAALGKAADIA